MKRLLITWLDRTTLSQPLSNIKQLLEPAAQLIQDQELSEAHLVCQYVQKERWAELQLLSDHLSCPVLFHYTYFANPAQLTDISLKFERLIQDLIHQNKDHIEFVFLFNSGMPQMAAVWSVMSDIYRQSTKYLTISSKRVFAVKTIRTHLAI